VHCRIGRRGGGRSSHMSTDASVRRQAPDSNVLSNHALVRTMVVMVVERRALRDGRRRARRVQMSRAGLGRAVTSSGRWIWGLDLVVYPRGGVCRCSGLDFTIHLANIARGLKAGLSISANRSGHYS
jgi:hypothetical protein